MANTLSSFLLSFAIRCEKDTVLVFKIYFLFNGPLEKYSEVGIKESSGDLSWGRREADCMEQQRWIFPWRLRGYSFYRLKETTKQCCLRWFCFCFLPRCLLYLGASFVIWGVHFGFSCLFAGADGVLFNEQPAGHGRPSCTSSCPGDHFCLSTAAPPEYPRCEFDWW